MKQLFVLLFAFSLSLDSSAIKPILVKFSCNLKTINKQEGDKRTQFTLNDDYCGWCYIRKDKHPKELVGHNGLLIYKKPYTQEFRVYDLKCPVCDKKKVNSSIYVNEGLEGECDKCKTRYSIFHVGHPLNLPSAASEGLWLESYDFIIEDDIMYIDSSPGLGQRLRLWESSQH